MNYLDRALGDIKSAELLISPAANPTGDEALIDITGYHVQQAIEKELKHILHDIHGYPDDIRNFRTHDIDDLISIVEDQTDFVVPDEIKEIAADLTAWEAGARYGSSVTVTLDEVAEALNCCKSLVNTIADYVDNKNDCVDNDVKNTYGSETEDDFDDDYDPVD